MVKKLKRTLMVLIFVAVLVPVFVVTAFVLAVSFMDFNKYKPMIEQEVAAKTGHELQILGDLEASVMPLQLSIGQSQLRQAAGFDQTQPLLSFEKMNLRVSLPALLLRGQVHLLAVEWLEPELTLVRDKQGQVNWPQALANADALSSGLAGFVKVSNQRDDANSLAEEAGLVALLAPLALLAQDYEFKLNSLTVHDGQVAWQDALAEQDFVLDKINLLALDLALGQAVRLQLEARLINQQTGHQYQFDQQSRLQVSPDFSQLTLSGLTSELTIQWPTELARNDLRLNLALDEWQWDWPNNQLTLDGLSLSSRGDKVSLSAQGQHQPDWDMQGDIQLSKLNLRHWLDYFDLTYPAFVEDKALTQLSGSFSWQFDHRAWSLAQIELMIDQTRLIGQFGYQNGVNELYQFDLALGELNFDFYAAEMRAKTTTELAATTDQPTAAAEAEPPRYLPLAVPVTTLRESQVQGQIKIEQLQIWQGQYQQVNLGLNSRYGQLDIKPFDADLYGGSWRSELRVDVNADTPSYAIKGRMQGVNSQSFLHDIVEYDQLSGTLSSRFDITTAGSNVDAIKYNLNGLFSAELNQGQYRSLDINKLLAGQASQAGEATALNKVVLSGELLKGIYHIQRATLESERFNARAFGRVHIPKAEIDAELQLTYQNPPAGLQMLKGVQVPIKLKGSLSQPQWQVDLDKLLGADNLQRLMQFLR